MTGKPSTPIVIEEVAPTVFVESTVVVVTLEVQAVLSHLVTRKSPFVLS